MTTFLRRLSTAAAAATAFIAAALIPAPAAAQNVTPVKNGWLYGTGSLSQSVTSGVTTSGTLTVTTGGFLILNTGGTLSLSAGTITGSPGIIPASLVSGGIGTVTGMTLTLGGALTGSLTNTASVPALTLTLSTFPSASLSGTITNGQLANSSITVGGTSISLGGSASTLTSLTLSSLTVSGLSTAGFVVNNAAGLLSTTNSISTGSLSGTLFSLYAGGGAIAVTPASTVSLAAGTNVTITRLGNTITLSSASNSGTVTGFVVTPSNGVLAGVTTSASVPTLTISLGAITPTSISDSGTLSVSGATTLGSTLVLGGALTGAGATFTNITNSGAVSGFVLANAAGLQSTTTSIPVASVSGAVSQVTSGNSLIAITNTTSTPQLTLTTSPAFNALTATGAVTLSGITTPAASTGYVVQINTTSGAISTTTASAGGGGTVTGLTLSTAGPITGIVSTSTSTPRVSLTASATNGYSMWVVEGDSTSASTSTAWPTLVWQNNRIFSIGTFQNLASGGASTPDIISTFTASVIPYAPTATQSALFSLMSGANDTGSTSDQIYTNLKTLWALARNNGFTVVAMTPPALQDSTGEPFKQQRLASLIRSDPSLYTYLVDASAVIGQYNGNYGNFTDNVHPSATGYSLIASNFQQVVGYQPFSTAAGVLMAQNSTGGVLGAANGQGASPIGGVYFDRRSGTTVTASMPAIANRQFAVETRIVIPENVPSSEMGLWSIGPSTTTNASASSAPSAWASLGTDGKLYVGISDGGGGAAIAASSNVFSYSLSGQQANPYTSNEVSVLVSYDRQSTQPVAWVNGDIWPLTTVSTSGTASFITTSLASTYLTIGYTTSVTPYMGEIHSATVYNFAPTTTLALQIVAARGHVPANLQWGTIPGPTTTTFSSASGLTLGTTTSFTMQTVGSASNTITTNFTLVNKIAWNQNFLVSFTTTTSAGTLGSVAVGLRYPSGGGYGPGSNISNGNGWNYLLLTGTTSLAFTSAEIILSSLPATATFQVANFSVVRAGAIAHYDARTPTTSAWPDSSGNGYTMSFSATGIAPIFSAESAYVLTAGGSTITGTTSLSSAGLVGTGSLSLGAATFSALTNSGATRFTGTVTISNAGTGGVIIPAPANNQGVIVLDQTGRTISMSGGGTDTGLTISHTLDGSNNAVTTISSGYNSSGQDGYFKFFTVDGAGATTQVLTLRGSTATVAGLMNSVSVSAPYASFSAVVLRGASLSFSAAGVTSASLTVALDGNNNVVNTFNSGYNNGVNDGYFKFFNFDSAGASTQVLTLRGSTATVAGLLTSQSHSATALTASGALTFSGITTPAASTGYVVQINTTSGAISTTTASAGGGGYSTASASSGLVAASVSATTVSYGSYIFHGITSSASPALNTATLSLAAGSTFTTSGSSVQISSSNSASVLTVSGSPTLSGSGTITYSALPFLASNQTFSGANTFSGTVSLSTLSGTVSLAGQFDGTNGIRIQSTGSTANVLTLKSASQSAARTLTLSIDASATVSVASLLYTNQTQNATLGTITASNVSVTTISSTGGTVNFPLTTINTTDLKAVNTISASTITVGTNLTVNSISLSGTDLYAPSLASGGGSGDVVYFDTGTGQLTHDSAPSDPRTKDNIAPLGLGLAELRKLADAQGDIAFNYKPGFNSQPDLRRGGFNARTLADVSPLLAHDRGTLNGVEHVLEPEERAVQAMTVRAVAELSAQVAALRAVVYALVAIMFTYAFILLSSRKNRS